LIARESLECTKSSQNMICSMFQDCLSWSF